VSDRRTPDAKLIEAVRILSRTINTEDGVIPACLGEVATRLAELVEERRWVPVLGEIVDMKFSTEIGVYYGAIRCPECDQDVSVSPMADRPKCRCGVQWDFSVSAVGEQPQPPGPEGKA
jgi:hypothetical protein